MSRFVLILVASADLLALGGARYLVARAFGIAEVGFFFSSGARTTLVGISRWARPAIVAACLAVTYAIPAAVLTAGLLVNGRSTISSSTVRVVAGRPAEQAGMADGDRVTSIGARKIGSWSELVATLREHAGEPVDIAVERAGSEFHITATPGAKGIQGEGTIGVRPMSLTVAVGAGEALLLGLQAPMSMLTSVARALVVLLGTERENLPTGPVGIAHESASTTRSGVGDALLTAGAFGAYFWPITALISLFVLPRRRVPARAR